MGFWFQSNESKNKLVTKDLAINSHLGSNLLKNGDNNISQKANLDITVVEPHRKSRFYYWLSLIALSGVSLVATIDATYGEGRDKYQNLALLCSGTTLVISFVVSLMHISSVTTRYVVGTKFEGLCSYILMICWDVGLAVMSKPDNNLALDKDTGYIKNANIYFSSWGAFVVTVIIFAKYIQSIHNINLRAELKRRPRRLTLWFGLMASSLILSGSSGDIYTSKCETENSNISFCVIANRSVILGLCTGFVGLGMACFLLFSSENAKTLIFLSAELVVSFVMATVNGIGVSHITRESGPGGVINNLFFASWGCLCLSIWIFFNCLDEISSNKEKRQIERACYHDMSRREVLTKINGNDQIYTVA